MLAIAERRAQMLSGIHKYSKGQSIFQHQLEISIELGFDTATLRHLVTLTLGSPKVPDLGEKQ